MINKKAQIFWTVWNVVEAFAVLAAGLLCILFRDQGNFQNIIGYVITGFIGLDGSLKIILYFTGFKKTEESTTLIGGFEIALAVVVALNANQILALLTQFLFSLLMVMGALILAMAILQIIKHKSTLFMPILTTIFGAILLALGLTICIVSYSNGDTAIVLKNIIIGSIFVIVGGAQFIMTMIQQVKAKKQEKKTTPPAKAEEKVEAPEMGKAYEAKNSKDIVENSPEIEIKPKEIENK